MPQEVQTLNVDLPVILADRLTYASDKFGLSKSTIIRNALTSWLDRNEIPKNMGGE